MLEMLTAATSGAFDVETATRAYLDTLQGPAREASDSYFEGGYWLILWGALVAILIDWLLLNFRLSAAFRNLAERITKRSFLVTFITAAIYTLAASVLTLPWAIYTGFFREKKYDLLDQSFGAWFGEQMIGLAISLIMVSLLIAVVYTVIRRAPKTWWLWATGVVGLFLIFGLTIAPVFISPLFNTYTEMEEGPLRDRIVAMAAEHDVPADNIYVFDQSKQNKRISANVSGFGPTIRISLNDNLLERTSEEEVVAVMGHELGHYKLSHGWWRVMMMLVIIGLGLFVVSRAAPWLIARYGDRWGIRMILDDEQTNPDGTEDGTEASQDSEEEAETETQPRGIADPASLPVLGIILSAYFMLATPAFNNITRVQENQADAFGLDAGQEPDGFARAAMRLSEYRKIEAGELEEFLFYTHPSGENRVRRSMQWKADNVPDAQIVTPEEGYLDAE